MGNTLHDINGAYYSQASAEEGADYAIYAPKTLNVVFNSNGGTGTMPDQNFVINGGSKPLSKNLFTRTNYVFRGWNTMPDGSGTHYDDEEVVNNLSTTDGDIVTLYAEWWKVQYAHAGDAVFDGTASTFIDTGVNVFSTTNINKDFEIRFTFKSVDRDSNSSSLIVSLSAIFQIPY